MGGIDWFNLFQERDRWQLLLIAVMNLRISQKAGSFLTEDLLASQEGLFSMALVETAGYVSRKLLTYLLWRISSDTTFGKSL